MNPALTVFLKEVRENLRDRKTVINALVMGPLIGPIVFAAMMSFMLTREMDKAEQPLEVPVAGAEHAVNLVGWLTRHGMVVQPAPKDAEAAVRVGDEALVLRIPASYPAAWRAGETAQVELLFDGSDRDSATPVKRMQHLLEGYQREQSLLRTAARGISPALQMPIAIATRDLATARERSAQLLSFLPYFMVIGAFLGGMYLAIDTTAGERERQSLEPLLANPVGRGQIVSGKLAATFAFAIASLLISLIAFSLAFGRLPLDQMGIRIEMGPGLIATALLLMAPLTFFLAALQTVVAAYAKSYREAQTYLSLLMIVPMIPSLLLMLLPVKTELWMMAVPLLSQHLLVIDLVRGEDIPTLHFAISLGTSLLLALLMAFVAVRIYHREALAVSA